MNKLEPIVASGDPEMIRARLWQAHRHGRRVRTIRGALFFAAGAILALAVVVTAFATLTVPTPTVEEGDLEDGRVVMGAPKLEGRNSSNQPYRIEAESALQSPDDLNRLELRGISGDLPLGSDSRVSFRSDAGFYDAENQLLDFLAPLDLETSDGETVRVQDGRIDLLSGSFTSDKPIRLTTKTATLTADSVRIDSRTRAAIFEGSVRMRLVPDDVRPKAEAPQAETFSKE